MLTSITSIITTITITIISIIIIVIIIIIIIVTTIIIEALLGGAGEPQAPISNFPLGRHPGTQLSSADGNKTNDTNKHTSTTTTNHTNHDNDNKSNSNSNKHRLPSGLVFHSGDPLALSLLL